MSEVTREAHAKVNLLLRILSRYQNGFHGLETLFCRLELNDTLTARRHDGPGVSIEVSGAETGPAAENLAVKAAEAVLAQLRTPFGVSLELTKRIPVGAGLGGGSADAAATLHAVNELAGNSVPRVELFHLAAKLGADVPFCLADISFALAWGRGERMLELPPLPHSPILLLTPKPAVKTAEAYRWLDEAWSDWPRRGALALSSEALGSWSNIARMAGNDFESVVFGRLPGVREAFEALARTGPLLCRMTGSGSTLFAVYRNERDREDARMTLGKKHGSVVATWTA